MLLWIPSAGQKFHQVVQRNCYADFVVFGPGTGSQRCLAALHSILYLLQREFCEQTSVVF